MYSLLSRKNSFLLFNVPFLTLEQFVRLKPAILHKLRFQFVALTRPEHSVSP